MNLEESKRITQRIAQIKKEPYKKYTLRCQKCGEKIRLEIRFYQNKKEIIQYFKYELNTDQNKQLLFNQMDIYQLFNYWWDREKKKLVRRLYGYASKNFKEKAILCDRCRKIEKLKE